MPDQQFASSAPDEFYLHPAYPNPFNPVTTIQYSLPKQTKVNISIFNMLGQLVRVLDAGIKQAGTYTIHWDGNDTAGNMLASGVYLCHIRTGEYRRSIKLMLIR